MVNVAKKKGRRKFRKYVRGVVDEVMELTTLAARTLVSEPFDDSVNGRSFVTSIDGVWSLSSMTPLADSGPILVGLAHSDYSNAEIEAFIENTGSWNEGDLVNQEIAKRKIKIVGSFANPGTAATAVQLNDGRKIKTKVKTLLNQGQTFRLWAYNAGTVAVSGTTVPEVTLFGAAHIWPT